MALHVRRLQDLYEVREIAKEARSMNEMGLQSGIGRIVRYVLSEADAAAIRRRRVAKPHEHTWPMGAQAHVGNPPSKGDVVPLIVVRVFPDEFGPDIPGVNGQAFLDGNDSLWLTSVREGAVPGTWHWPSRV